MFDSARKSAVAALEKQLQAASVRERDLVEAIIRLQEAHQAEVKELTSKIMALCSPASLREANRSPEAAARPVVSGQPRLNYPGFSADRRPASPKAEA